MDLTSSQQMPADPDVSTSRTGIDAESVPADGEQAGAILGPGPSPGGAARWDSAGQRLKTVRERIGYRLIDVATSLRIRIEYLQAIEDGRYAALPGTTYALGFIRSYAGFLGLDAQTVVRLYKSELNERTPAQPYYLPTPKAETRVPGGLMLLVSLIAGCIAYGGWYYISSNGAGGIDPLPRVPDRLAALLAESGAPVDGLGLDRGAHERHPEDLSRGLPLTVLPDDPAHPRRGSETIPLAALPDDIARTLLELEQGTAARLAGRSDGRGPSGAGAGAGADGVTSETAGTGPIVARPPESDLDQVVLRLKPGAEASREAAGADPAERTAGNGPTGDGPTGDGADRGLASTPADAAAPTADDPSIETLYGDREDPSRIMLKAVADSWIQVKDGRGRLLFTRLLRPGEAYRVPDQPGVRLKVGNAGGLVVLVDNIEVPPLGQSGEVLRVSMDPAQLKQRAQSVAN